MRLIDADAIKETIEFHPTSVSVCMTVAEAKGQTEFKNRCLDDIDNAPTIDAIPVDWLKQQYQKCEEIKNKIPITLEPNIHDVAVGLKCTELIGAIDIVLNLYAGWQKEQEAR